MDLFRGGGTGRGGDPYANEKNRFATYAKLPVAAPKNVPIPTPRPRHQPAGTQPLWGGEAPVPMPAPRGGPGGGTMTGQAPMGGPGGGTMTGQAPPGGPGGGTMTGQAPPQPWPRQPPPQQHYPMIAEDQGMAPGLMQMMLQMLQQGNSGGGSGGGGGGGW
jgi:hypothetical protein